MKEVRSIAEAVFLNAKEKPDAKAVIDKSGPVTYRQMKESITSCALILSKLGVRTGDRVVAECSQDAMFLAFDLACEVTGAIFVGVERKVAPGRLEEILEQTQPVLLVTNRPAQISRKIRKCLTWKEWNALLSARQEEMKTMHREFREEPRTQHRKDRTDFRIRRRSRRSSSRQGQRAKRKGQS